jgi:hypothetical protein
MKQTTVNHIKMATLNSMLITKSDDSQNDNILILLVSRQPCPSPRGARYQIIEMYISKLIWDADRDWIYCS